MYKIIEELNKWINGYSVHYDSKKFVLQYYDEETIKRDMFCKKKKCVFDELMQSYLTKYIQYLEQILSIEDNKFKIEKYSNLDQYITSEYKGNSVLVTWLKRYFINEINTMIQFISDKVYNPIQVYAILDYYDYTISSAIQYREVDQAIDYFIEYSQNILNKLSQLEYEQEKIDIVINQGWHIKELDEYESGIGASKITSKFMNTNLDSHKESAILQALSI